MTGIDREEFRMAGTNHIRTSAPSDTILFPFAKVSTRSPKSPLKRLQSRLYWSQCKSIERQQRQVFRVFPVIVSIEDHIILIEWL